jgi:hypothetical protein
VSKDEQEVFTQSATQEDNAYHLEPFEAGGRARNSQFFASIYSRELTFVLSATDTETASIGLVDQNAEGFESL